MRNLLLRLLYLLLRSVRPTSCGRGEIASVLVLQYQMPLGCCVHGTPIYAALKAACPGITITVATRGAALAILRHDPHIDHLIATGDPMAGFQGMAIAARHLRRELRRRELAPNLVLQDASNRRGRFALFASLLRLAPTAGFADAAPLYDTRLEYDPDLSLIDNNLRLAGLAGAPVRHIEPAVYFTVEELDRARVLLHEVNPAHSPAIAFAVQGSGGQRTGWHDDRFAAVMRHVESLGYRAIVLGAAADVESIQRIRAVAGGAGTSLAGRTSIPELAALLCLCDFLVSIDTGIMHVGRAADLPIVVLGPSWQKPLEWLPLRKPNARILRGEDRGDAPADYRLDEIVVEEVISAMDALQRRFPPSEADRQSRVTRLLSATRA